MKLQQLRYVVEIVRQGNHLSAAADALHTWQPGVSRQIRLLEHELGFEIFVRTKNRIIGLTEQGEHILAIAQRITSDLDSLRSLGADLRAKDRGSLIVATTQTQARYVLPTVVKTFLERHPSIEFVLKRGNPEQVCIMVDKAEVDIAIGPEPIRPFPQLVKLHCFPLPRSVVGTKGHPIFDEPELTLQNIARYPLIAYDPRYTGQWNVVAEFRKGGHKPKITLSAIDADLCKTYAAMGLGLAILTSVSYEPDHDDGLSARDASHLFAPSICTIFLRPTAYVRPLVLDFISSVAEHLTPKVVRDAIRATLAENAAASLSEPGSAHLETQTAPHPAASHDIDFSAER